jgi:UDP-glucose 4-epimerase
MPATRKVSPFEPRAHERRELVRLIRRIQALTLEIHELQRREGATRELHAKERTREQLRWRLASVARRAAADNLDAAA